jgi:hypothetical protein
VQRLCDKAILHAVDGAKRGEIEVWLIQEAFRAGADRELEACCEWLDEGFGDVGNFPAILRTARRPKPKSLKEQALAALSRADKDALTNPLTGKVVDLRTILSKEQSDTIRRALEALPND